MRQRWVKFDFSIAIVLSVLVHVGLIWWMLHDQIEALARLVAQGIAGQQLVQVQKNHSTDEDLGETGATGTAIAPSPGDEPASGMQADMDQPFLSRDPAGMGKVGDRPSPYAGPTGGGALANEMQQSAASSAAAAATPEDLELRPPDPIDPPSTIKQPTKPVDEQAKRAEPTHVPQPTNAMPPESKTGVADATNPRPSTAKPEADPKKFGTPTNPKPTMAGVPEHPVVNVDKSTVKPAPQDTPADSKAVADASPPPLAPDPAKPTETTTKVPKPLDPNAIAMAPPDAPPADPDASADRSPYQTATPPKLPSPDSPTPSRSTPSSPKKAGNGSPATPASTPGLSMQSADPAPQADSEIDPFAKIASAEFRAGKTTVRAGRKAKLTRPKIPLVGFWDGVALGQAAVTLHLVLDTTGQVVQADVVQSSGSSEIDNPICQEAYNWWFEPNKNAAGEPVKTEFPFTVCVFR